MNTVLVPLPDGRTLALELAEFIEAIARGEQMASAGQPAGIEPGIEVLDVHRFIMICFIHSND